MPTGYTAKLMEEGQTTKEFVMGCLRAMSCCVSLRDSDEPIPKEFKVSDYHVKALKKATKLLKKLESFTDKQKVNYNDKEAAEAIKRDEELYNNAAKENERLDEMRKQIEAWNPGDRYISFKDFMLEQLDISRHNLKYYEREKNVISHYDMAVESAKRDVKYHKEEIEKEAERVNENNLYIKGIRASLKNIK